MDSFLLEVYNLTINKEEALLNVASVKQGVRSGAIIVCPVENVDELLDLLKLNKVYAKLYPLQTQINRRNIIITNRPDRLRNLRESNTFDSTVGKILGYYSPFQVFKEKYPNNGYVSVSLQLPDRTVKTIKMVPQVLRTVNKDVEDYFENLADGIRSLELPKDYIIISSEPYISKKKGGRMTKKQRKPKNKQN